MTKEKIKKNNIPEFELSSAEEKLLSTGELVDIANPKNENIILNLYVSDDFGIPKRCRFAYINGALFNKPKSMFVVVTVKNDYYSGNTRIYKFSNRTKVQAAFYGLAVENDVDLDRK